MRLTRSDTREKTSNSGLNLIEMSSTCSQNVQTCGKMIVCEAHKKYVLRDFKQLQYLGRIQSKKCLNNRDVE